MPRDERSTHKSKNKAKKIKWGITIHFKNNKKFAAQLHQQQM